MNFYFLNTISIRNFAAVLLILDVKKELIWQFPTKLKCPTLDIVKFFFSQRKRIEREVQHIRTDYDGEPAGSSKFCALIKNNFEVGFEQTGTYSS